MIRLPEKIIKYKLQIKLCLIVALVGFCFLGCVNKQISRPVIFDSTQKPDQYRIRVLLFDNIKECELSSTEGFSVKDSSMTLLTHFGSLGGAKKISVEDGNTKIGDHKFNSDIYIVPDRYSVLEVKSQKFRGDLKIIVSADGNSFRVVNTLHIEEYLAGVVGAEMPSYWEYQALKAQAMAARTYCIFIKNRFGQNRQWDVQRTQANQVYRGIAAETARVRQAVDETRGLVLVCRHRDGQIKIFPTYYSSACGGHTEDSYNVFGDFYPSLVGVDCPHCKKTARKEYMNWKPVEFTEKDIASNLVDNYPSLSSLGTITNIEEAKITSYGTPGRFTSVKITGKDGNSSYLRGEDLRLTVDPAGTKIKSTYCRIKKTDGKYRFYDGKGFGHGVGMCQHGAQALARNGSSYKEILAYYYSGSQMKRIY